MLRGTRNLHARSCEKPALFIDAMNVAKRTVMKQELEAGNRKQETIVKSSLDIKYTL